jgi:DeoR/GlpR family transcriptional regulator of sugar metabolism
MLSEKRKSEIQNIIKQKGIIEVNALADLFQTSRETIRRDLSELERQGVLKRTHGGAVQNGTAVTISESPVAARSILQIAEKKSICEKAARFISANDTLFVDNSSTASYLPHYIPPDMYITIITNSIGFLYETTKINNCNWVLICLGGIFNSRGLSVLGNSTLKSADAYYPTKTFISCAGISPINKIADFSPHEVEIKQLMIERTREVFLLADHTKFKNPGHIFLCDFDSIDHLITDSPPEDTSFLNKLDLIVAK